MTSADRTARGRLQAAALGVVCVLLVPLPAAAAPAPCGQALRYAAQSGIGLMRIGNLDLGPAGRTDQPITNIAVGDVKSALVAQAPLNAAAVGRVLDGVPAGRKSLGEVLRQAAPPNLREPEQRLHDATEVGPFRLGKSKLALGARWLPGMACGNASGEATRAEVELRRAGVLDGEDGALVRVPQKISGRSTTAMERRGAAARAAASASMTGGRVELLSGAVKVKIVQPPSLLATMSGTDGGEVRYRPAVLIVSGEGFESARLDTAGDSVELRLDQDGNPDQDGNDGSAAGPQTSGNGPASTDQDGAAGRQAGKGPVSTDQDGAAGRQAGKGRAGMDQDRAAGGEPAGTAGRDESKAGTAGRDESKAGTAGRDASKAGTAGRDASKVGAGGVSTSQGASAGRARGGSDAGREQHGADPSGAGKTGAGPADSRNRAAGTTGASGTESTDARKPGGRLFAGLPEVGRLGSATPLPVPPMPAVPPLIDPPTEAAPAAGPGTTVRVSLGDVRQAVSGHAIAAKATAIRITIANGPDRQAYAGSSSSGVVLDLGLGLLEAAAVAPEPAAGDAAEVADGVGGGLPITGPRVDLLALTGVALLIAGAVALGFGLRGRSRSWKVRRGGTGQPTV